MFQRSTSAKGIDVSSGAQFWGYGTLKLDGGFTYTDANSPSNTPTLRLYAGQTKLAADGGSISNFLGSGQAATVYPALVDNPTSPYSGFGSLGGGNINFPYVAMYDYGGSNAFVIYKWPYGAAPNCMVEVARIDQAGNIIATGNVQGVGATFSGTAQMATLNVTSSVGSCTGLKHARAEGCSTSSIAGATCTTTINWPGDAFSNTSYTVSCSGEGITAGVPVSGGITEKTTTSVTFQTVAGTASAAKFGRNRLHCHARLKQLQS